MRGSDDKILDTVKCPAVCALLSRALDAGLRVRKNTEPMFTEWVVDCLCRYHDVPKLHRVSLVSGELNTSRWDELMPAPLRQEDDLPLDADASTIGEYLVRHYLVYGVCCHYVDASDLEEAPTSDDVFADENELNKMFHYFLRHARRDEVPNKRVRLYCSNIRLDGHWLCVGNRMRIPDWHEPAERHRNTGETAQKSPVYEIWSGFDDPKQDAQDSRVMAFAEQEFRYVLADLRAYWAFDQKAQKQYNLWYRRHFFGQNSFSYADCTLNGGIDDGIPFLVDESDVGVRNDCGIPFLVDREDVGAEGNLDENRDEKTFVFLKGDTIRKEYETGNEYLPPDPEKSEAYNRLCKKVM